MQEPRLVDSARIHRLELGRGSLSFLCSPFMCFFALDHILSEFQVLKPSQAYIFQLQSTFCSGQVHFPPDLRDEIPKNARFARFRAPLDSVLFLSSGSTGAVAG